MALKTQQTAGSVTEFVKNIENEQQRKDCKALLKVFKEATGMRPKLWNNGTIGYGTYYYKSDRSKQEGEWYLTGFAPRKGNITVYVMIGTDNVGKDLAKLGKHKPSGGSCIYIKKLEDVDTKVLARIIKNSVKEMKKTYGV